MKNCAEAGERRQISLKSCEEGKDTAYSAIELLGQPKVHISSSHDCHLAGSKVSVLLGQLKRALQIPVQMEVLTCMFLKTGLPKELGLGKINGCGFHIINWLQAYYWKIIDSLTVCLKSLFPHYVEGQFVDTALLAYDQQNAYSPMSMPPLHFAQNNTSAKDSRYCGQKICFVFLFV